ncbi:Trihelix transcription factor GT-2 [Acorus calamus]|uniref:Trihelix transcription factor GT-2 n=1 Tax=Acorus calamus TaxID=4465 RepID=A0AAV9DSV0_ACOCL|nr:Trihelix transcription factor GT-2 [Acorus calamus]
MQHQGGSQYVVPPDMTPFSAAAAGNRPLVMEHLQPPPPPVAEKASPISSRPPPSGFEDPIVGNYAAEDDALASAAAGEEMERGGVSGNRWPRQETLALLKIRSDMDSAFRDATLKGPLWEDVSRKLADLGYTRSAKKCKEKFENVHKYYKRTKEGRAGRQDGKNYRFFSQLEALNSAAAVPNGLLPPPPPVLPHPMPISSAPPPPNPMPGISFSSNSSSSEESETDDDETEAAALGGGGGRKRKARSSKMMELVEGMMRRVMERQEEMQKRFLETMERREQERVMREEAWKRQEIAQLNREHDLLAQERSLSTSRNSAIVSFLQKITGGQSVTLEQPPPPPPSQPPKRPPPVEVVPIQEAPPPQMTIITTTSTTTVAAAAAATATATSIGGIGFDSASSRWPKAEVHALIKLRSGMETRYQEAGPKGPLWEEISAGMRRMGYNRSSKRCKEKWENINKYFKKVKESNKKRPEDAKTCPYFHQLDALYRKKNQEPASSDVLAIMPPPPPPPPPPPTQTQTQIAAPENKNENDNIERNGGNGEGGHTSNGGSTPTCEGPSLKKPEDIMKELIEHHQNQQNQAGMDAYESDNIDGEDDEDDEDEENGKMAYKIQFQRPPSAAPSNGGGNVAVTKTTTPGSFLAMVQ